MNILLEHGNHSLANLGDLAMLQVAAANVNRLWPNSVIHVPTLYPERVANHVPAVQPVPIVPNWALPAARAAAALPPAVRERLASWLRAAAKAWNERTGTDARAGGMHAHDLILMAGSGIFADPFRAPARARLESLASGQQLGIPTALMSQGLGPITEAPLKELAAQVFGDASLITLRERVHGPDLLRAWGVAPERVRITGDDSLALAVRTRRSALQSDSLGLNLRLAPYSGMALRGDAPAEEIVEALREFAADQADSVVPLAVHRRDYRRMAPALSARRRAPLANPHRHAVPALIEAIGGCRLVVAGSYHAAVLALGQGIPALCLAGSRYYRWKFAGLADLFPTGCRVLDIEQPGLPGRLHAALDELWMRAGDLHRPLREAAQDQVERSAQAYRDIKEITT